MKEYLLPISIIILAVAVFTVFSSEDPVGSSVVGNDYQSTQLTTTDVGTSTLKTRQGSVGSLVVSNVSSAATIVLYDTASTTIATSSATQIFSFDATAVEGTYQYDIQFGTGLMIDVPSAFDGNIVLTYR